MRGRVIFPRFPKGFEIDVAGKAGTGAEELGCRRENPGTGANVKEPVARAQMPFQGFERKLRRRLIAGAGGLTGVDGQAEAAGWRWVLSPGRDDVQALAYGEGIEGIDPFFFGVLPPVRFVVGKYGQFTERLGEEGFQFADFSGKIVFGYAGGPEFV